MRPLFKWIAAIVGVLVIAIVLVVVFFEWNWLRGPLQSRLSAATGKQVRIIGPIHGEYAWTPRITVEGIRIEEPDWQPDPLVGKIDRVEVTVELKRLLTGTLSIPSLSIVSPSATLERRDGKANWDIVKDTSGPGDRGNVPLLGDVSITDGKISYRDPAKRLSIDATISSIKGSGGTDGGPFTLEGKGTYQRAPFTLKLTGDSLRLMREKDDPYKIEIAANLGRTRILAGGTIEEPIKLKGIAMGVQVRGENAADLYPYLGIPAPATPPYQLGGTLDRYEDDIWGFRDFGGTVGQSDLKGSLTFDVGKPRLAIKGSLFSQRLALADLGLLVGVPTRPEGALSEDQRRVRERFEKSNRLLPDAPLQTDAIRNVDVDVTFKGAKVIAKDVPMERIDAHVKIAGGVMSIDPMQVGVAGGLLRGTAVIDARAEPVKSDVDLRFSEFQLEQFLKPENEADAAATGVIDGRLRFKGTGDSLAAALGTADGTASFIVGQGTISKLASSLMGLDVARTLGVLVTGDKKIELRCIVSDFELRKGVMTPRALVVDTSDTTVTGVGLINLADERMDMELKGKPKKATLSLRGPILLGGSFRDPSVGLGGEAIARAGGSAVLGALLTPVAAVVAFIDSGKKYDADCGALEASAEANAKKQPPVDKTPPRRQTQKQRPQQPRAEGPASKEPTQTR